MAIRIISCFTKSHLRFDGRNLECNNEGFDIILTNMYLTSNTSIVLMPIANIKVGTG